MEIIFIIILIAVGLALVYFISSSITLWIQAIVSTIIILIMIWLAWIIFRPAPREFSWEETNAVSLVCEETADLLTGEVPAKAVFGVAHLKNDSDDVFTRAMRKTISERFEWKVEEKPVIQKSLGDISTEMMRATSLEEFADVGRKLGLDVIVLGKVKAVKSMGDGARAEAMIYAFQVRTGEWAVKQTISQIWTPGMKDAAIEFSRASYPVLRFIIWILFVSLLPLLTSFIVHRALEKKTNLVSFILLAAYTALDLLAALILSGFRILGVAGGLAFIAAFLLCAGYNYFICGRLAKNIK